LILLQGGSADVRYNGTVQMILRRFAIMTGLAQKALEEV
jgi:hypothetical protein